MINKSTTVQVRKRRKSEMKISSSPHLVGKEEAPEVDDNDHDDSHHCLKLEQLKSIFFSPLVHSTRTFLHT